MWYCSYCKKYHTKLLTPRYRQKGKDFWRYRMSNNPDVKLVCEKGAINMTMEIVEK